MFRKGVIEGTVDVHCLSDSRWLCRCFDAWTTYETGEGLLKGIGHGSEWLVITIGT